MRIWDLPPEDLCRKHLLGEHVELHAMWSMLTKGGGGSWQKHPETVRWRGHLPALANRHEQLVTEMSRRGYNHKSPLSGVEGVTGSDAVPDPWQPIEVQKQLITERDCECNFAAE